ncbi:excisionase family DNA-binding protein [Luteolibacter flavescens]|uniref:excisionase family DNA-binding protein n=1 Tax=Luteolibacter flavescens TaxID=1859460 RepID=UPI003CCD09DD
MSAPVFNPRRATPRQLADHLSTSVPTVLSWHHAGIIPAVVSEGRVYRFDLEAVDQALAHRAQMKKGGAA